MKAGTLQYIAYQILLFLSLSFSVDEIKASWEPKHLPPAAKENRPMMLHSPPLWDSIY